MGVVCTVYRKHFKYTSAIIKLVLPQFSDESKGPKVIADQNSLATKYIQKVIIQKKYLINGQRLGKSLLTESFFAENPDRKKEKNDNVIQRHQSYLE